MCVSRCAENHCVIIDVRVGVLSVDRFCKHFQCKVNGALSTSPKNSIFRPFDGISSCICFPEVFIVCRRSIQWAERCRRRDSHFAHCVSLFVTDWWDRHTGTPVGLQPIEREMRLTVLNALHAARPKRSRCVRLVITIGAWMTVTLPGLLSRPRRLLLSPARSMAHEHDRATQHQCSTVPYWSPKEIRSTAG